MTKATELRELATLTTVASGQIQFDSDIKIAGDLITTGNTINITADTLNISDPNITLASGAANSAIADGAGITIDGADATLTWDDANSRFALNNSVYAEGAGGTGSSTFIRVFNPDDGAGHTGAHAGIYSANWGEAWLDIGTLDLRATGGDIRYDTGGVDATFKSTANTGFFTSGVAAAPPQKFYVQDNAMFGSYVGIGTASPQSKIHSFGNGFYQSALTLTREDISGYTGSVIFEKKKVDGSDNPTPLVTGDRIIQIYSQGYSNTAGDIRYGPEIVADLTADAVSGEALQADTKFASNGNTNFIVHYDGDVTARGAYNTEQVRHSIRPTLNLDFANSKELDPRITFYRDSIATYYDSKGVLRYANTNTPRFDHDPATGESKGLLIEESRTNIASAATLEVPLDFNNMYINKFMEVAPDRTYSGHHVLASPGVSRHEVNIKYPGTLGLVYTASVYVKPLGAVTWLSVSRAGGTDTMAFDLINLTTNVPGGTASGSISDAGDGWKKIEFTFTETSTGSLRSIYMSPGIGAPSSSVYTNLNGDGANGVALWGMQVEQASFATSYIPSDTRFTSRSSVATYHDENGILRTTPANSPRYGYKNDGRKWVETGLILENAASNLYSTSSGYSAIFSTTGSTTVTADYATAPDGSLTAQRLEWDSGYAYRYWPNVHGNDVVHTHSFYVKPISATSDVRHSIGGTPGSASWSFNFDAQYTEQVGGSGTTYGYTYEKLADGWWRVSVTFSLPDATGYVEVQWSGVGAGVEYYVWGMQVETGFVPSSFVYAPNFTTTTRSADVASSVAYTRDDDIAQITDSNFESFYNQDEGTTYVEVYPSTGGASQYAPTSFAYWDGVGTDDRINMRFGGSFGAGTVELQGAVESNDSGLNSFYNPTTTGTGTRGTLFKGAISMSDNNFIATSQGDTNVGTLTSLQMPYVKQLTIGSSFSNSYQLNGHVKKIAYYDQQLTSAELVALTENN